MSGKGENNGVSIEARAIIDPFIPFPIEPSQSVAIPNPSSTIPDSTVPALPTSPFITTPSIVPTLTEMVTITMNNPSLPAQSTVMPRKTAIITSTISVPGAQGNQKNTDTVNISAVILGIMVGLIIFGGSIVILIRRKFSKNKVNKKNQPQRPSIDENVHNNASNAELPEIISNDNHRMSQRDSSIYFHPQFPLPPIRHPSLQIPLPQHSPQGPQHSPQNPPIALYINSSSANNTGNYSSEPEHSAYTGVNPNYYQKYSQLQLPTATDIISSHSEQSQLSSKEIPE